MNFKVGDKVVVIAGKDKGKEGKIIKTLKNDNKVVVEETISACKHKITIPMEGRAESLNAAVAASIIMWEMMK